MLTATTPFSEMTTSSMPQQTSNKPDFFLKNSSSDLQSRLKARKVLGVGDATGTTSSSKISQILGQSDEHIFELPQQLASWLFATTILFICFTLMGLFWPTCLRLILPGQVDSTVHLATSYASLSTILGLVLRSRDRTSLEIALISLVLYHGLSFLTSIWFIKTNTTIIKSSISIVLHLFCLLININFYRSITCTMSSLRNNKLKRYFSSMTGFSTTSLKENSLEQHES